MKELSPEVQLKIIELANQWVEASKHAIKNPTPSQVIESKARRFDQAYKSILQTINGEEPVQE